MMKDFLDVEVTEDSKGCLQDIHWSMGAIGYFPVSHLDRQQSGPPVSFSSSQHAHTYQHLA